MQIPKPTDADKDRFRSLVPSDPHVEVKPMFGNLGAFVNGNMFMGLFGADVGLQAGARRRSGAAGRRGRRSIRARRATDGWLGDPAAVPRRNRSR